VTTRPPTRDVASSLLALLLCSGCQQPAPIPEAAPARGARVLSRGDGACDFDLSGTKAETVFYVLGVLNDYNGRFIVDRGDHVEQLYCNEQALADEFGGRLERLSVEQGLAMAERQQRQECLTGFRSAEIARRVDSCYQYELTDGMSVAAPNGPGRRHATTGTFNFGLLYGQPGPDRVRALAYLAGAWRRFGNDGAFRFANSSHKAEGIAHLLSALGCTDVSVEHTVGLIPGGWSVKFTPTTEVARRLGLTTQRKRVP
jgi:hypothetical protein